MCLLPVCEGIDPAKCHPSCLQYFNGPSGYAPGSLAGRILSKYPELCEEREPNPTEVFNHSDNR
jgi:hypothetical protein